MEELWPAGTDVAKQVLSRFLRTKARKTQIGDSSPLADGAEDSGKESRIMKYASDRDRVDFDSSSRIR